MSEAVQVDAPVVLLLVSDLMFSIKLTNDLKRLGYAPQTVTVKKLNDALASHPPLLLLDLMVRGQDWEGAIAVAQAAGLLAGVTVVAFGPHTDISLLRRAKAAGIRAVLANRKMMTDLPSVLRRYLGATTVDAEEDDDGEG